MSTRAAIIAELRWHSLQVSADTRWSFVEVGDSEGRVGAGEATLSGREQELARSFHACKGALMSRVPAAVDLAPVRSSAATLAEFAVVSALDQAVRDLASQQRGMSVGDALAPRRRNRVPVYANVNRGTRIRSPEGFAERARRAADDGFGAVKIAPFDGVELFGDASKSVDRALLDAALARIAAVRAAVGTEAQLMVDCHWRLNHAIAEAMIDALEPYRVHWLECPLPERPEFLDALRALRGRANERGMRLAGGEETSRVADFLPFLRAGVYDVMMPDVRYVGGIGEMLAVADTLYRHGVGFSPHNPSGPVCHAASLQICATTDHLECLEMQYRETPFFETLVRPALPYPVGGEIEVPRVPGIGVRLDPAVVAALHARTDG